MKTFIAASKRPGQMGYSQSQPRDGRDEVSRYDNCSGMGVGRCKMRDTESVKSVAGFGGQR